MAKEKNKIIVVVKDGYAQTVFSTDPKLQVAVIDRDALEQDGLGSTESAMEVAHRARDMTKVYEN